MITFWLTTILAGKANVELEADGIATGGASLGSPALSIAGMEPEVPVSSPSGGRGRRRRPVRHIEPEPRAPADLIARPIFAGPVQMGRPTVSQRHILSANGLSVGDASVGQPQMTRSFARLDNAFWHLAA